tara:strand:- start:149 stop:325 length:177 start_codon:yes stop_codon:yes gene_type:complete
MFKNKTEIRNKIFTYLVEENDEMKIKSIENKNETQQKRSTRLNKKLEKFLDELVTDEN